MREVYDLKADQSFGPLLRESGLPHTGHQSDEGVPLLSVCCQVCPAGSD